jgi:hypothetical protein
LLGLRRENACAVREVLLESAIAYFRVREVRSIKQTNRAFDAGESVQINIGTVIDVYIFPTLFNRGPVVFQFGTHEV